MTETTHAMEPLINDALDDDFLDKANLNQQCNFLMLISKQILFISVYSTYLDRELIVSGARSKAYRGAAPLDAILNEELENRIQPRSAGGEKGRMLLMSNV
jgi:hypothetical protein